MRFEPLNLTPESVLFTTVYAAQGRKRGPGVPDVRPAVRGALADQAGLGGSRDQVLEGLLEATSQRIWDSNPGLSDFRNSVFSRVHVAEGNPELRPLVGHLRIGGFVLRQRACP